MRKSLRTCVPIGLFVLAILATVGRVSAHHGWSGYDSSKVVSSRGPSWSRAMSIRMVLSGLRRRIRPGSSSLPRRHGWREGNYHARIWSLVRRLSWSVIPAAPTLKRCAQSASRLTVGQRSSDDIFHNSSLAQSQCIHQPARLGLSGLKRPA
jgi:hypothetical protein